MRLTVIYSVARFDGIAQYGNIGDMFDVRVSFGFYFLRVERLAYELLCVTSNLPACKYYLKERLRYCM